MEDILNEMRDLIGGYPDGSHQQADELLVKLVRRLADKWFQPEQGQVQEILKAYEQVTKWYA